MKLEEQQEGCPEGGGGAEMKEVILGADGRGGAGMKEAIWRGWSSLRWYEGGDTGELKEVILAW